MCLNSFDPTWEPPEHDAVLCVRAFVQKGSQLFSVRNRRDVVRPVGEWTWKDVAEQGGENNIPAVDEGYPCNEQTQYYPTGFHASLSEQGVRACAEGNDWLNWHGTQLVLADVILRKVHTKGEQDGHAVYVADEMYILPGSVRPYQQVSLRIPR